MKRPCPTCGRPVKAKATVCGYCGTDLTGRFSNPDSTPRTNPTAASPAPDPFSNPSGMLPMIGRTTKTVIVFVVALGVIAGAVVLFLFITKQVRRGLDSAGAAATSSPRTIIIDENEGQGSDSGNPDESRDLSGAREAWREMNANGAPCKSFNLVVETTLVSAASCFAGTEAWTIQVFFDDLSYDAVVANYTSNDTIHVAYGGNWTVLTQSKASSKKIAKALHGRAT
jgi:hypothetical protein